MTFLLHNDARLPDVRMTVQKTPFVVLRVLKMLSSIISMISVADLNYTGCIYKFIMSFKNRIGNSNGYVKQRLGTAPNNFQRNIGITSQNEQDFDLLRRKEK
ncbi:hypothetical protein Avbf_06702 [Armadillidium vulgare]|nr:hypothetical protein Avbf_06702 [Armadillidium vulgare]